MEALYIGWVVFEALLIVFGWVAMRSKEFNIGIACFLAAFITSTIGFYVGVTIR